MDFGVSIQSDLLGPDPDDVRRFALACQAAGYDYVAALDHVVGADTGSRPDWTGFYDATNSFREPLVLLGFIAGVAPALGLATGILVLPQRPAALVAKQVAELDLLSGGRVRLGVGIGWNAVEYEALGASFGDRAERYEEQIELMRALWTERAVDFDGKFHRVDRAGIHPLPNRRPIPIWMGGGTSRRVLERIGRLGDGWIAMGEVQLPNDATRAAFAIIQEAARSAGRDPDALGIEARIPLRGGVRRDEIKREVEAWRSMGARHVSLYGLPRNRPVDEYIEIIQTCRPMLDAAA